MSVLVVLLLVLMIVIGGVFLASITSKKTGIQEDDREGLNPDSRSLYSKSRQLKQEIEKLAAAAPKGSPTYFVGREAVVEAGRVVSQLKDTLLVRQKLKKLAFEASAVDIEIEKLQSQANQAESEGERSSFLSAVEAKQAERAHYDEITTLVATLDADMRKAEAGLSEMRARLAVGVGRDSTAGMDTESLRESLAQLKGLSLSVDDAQALMSERVAL